MIRFNNFSEGQEDFFLIEIVDNESTTNILVDGGIDPENCLDHIKKNVEGKLDYIILTHIDQDHIKGLLKLLDDKVVESKVKDTVFVYNKFTTGIISYRQAEKFEELIKGREIICSYREYQYNSGNAIFLSAEQRRKLPKKEKSQIYITFLSPTARKEIELLYDYYQQYKEKHKNPSGNEYVVNKSSIMCLIEFEEALLLMTGDGYLKDILPTIEMLTGPKTICPLSKNVLIKIPHHGSYKNNEGLEEIIKLIPCEKFVLTNVDKKSLSKNNAVKIADYILNLSQEKTIYSNSEYEGLNADDKQSIEL
ncbi:MBL fold metallo-hydrolase [Butyrivibrio sp. YAB3001]|uniref:MBL fold metallo-hydrolase n=1 Tax=Butyrivibrio sp. YAB3001 TaxID=1520812 RepID=UPI0008F658B0|nr:MBL fold metallo-hydrolase [Butyrivibrio sp. YAB3001]SFD08470.1 Metallo-beta-lactamase superfamily protein [Butyrivibrio sp. YAB3001]